MTNLIDKLERADGPDRELDQAIAVWHKNSARTDGRKVIGVANCAAYTASIDAAMTLVPEGWATTVEIFSNGEGYAFVRNNMGSESGNATASTPALALCIASLKAREHG